MLFLMLLRCDLKKIIKLGPKMLIGFFSASISIGVGFVVSYGIFHKLLGPESWKALAALCGSWLGGGSNMLAIQAILDVSEESLAYSLVMDSVCAVIYVMFLLWVINFSKEFNSWTKADVRLIDEVGASLEKEAREDKRPLTWKNMLLLIGVSFFISSLSKDAGVMVASVLPVFDKATWTVLLVTAVGLIVAMTPFGKIKGTEEVSNIMLYIVIAMIASRADISAMGNAPVWISHLLCGETGRRESRGQEEALVEQLVELNRQLAEKNRRARRIWKAVGIAVALFLLFYVLLVVLESVAFQQMKAEEGVEVITSGEAEFQP